MENKKPLWFVLWKYKLIVVFALLFKCKSQVYRIVVGTLKLKVKDFAFKDLNIVGNHKAV